MATLSNCKRQHFDYDGHSISHGAFELKSRILIVALSAALLSGCFRPSAEQLANADYGPYPDDYEQIIKSYMAQRLKDPYSAQYQFVNPPRQGWNGIGGLKFGYVSCVFINAKNSFGGYTGSTLNYFMLRGSSVIDASHGDDQYSASMVQGKCKAFM